MSRPLLHLDTARELPHWQDSLVASAVDRALPRVGWHLAAMAKPPGWVRGLTHGRPDHAYAVGEEVALMEAALRARATSLFAQGSTAMDDYRAALDRRWAGVDFRPGVWRWRAHDGGEPQPGRELVRDGSRIACTCPRGPCHLRRLAPWLIAAGWDVLLHGERAR